jgi:hypothetical protein
MTVGFVAMGILLWKPLPMPGYSYMCFGFRLVGAVFYFRGVGFYLWGLATMRSQFAGSTLFGAELYDGHKLVTNGPFAIVRHPLYVGVILAAIGALLIFRTWAMVVFMPLSLVVLEERSGRKNCSRRNLVRSGMRTHPEHPDGYQGYDQRSSNLTFLLCRADKSPVRFCYNDLFVGADRDPPLQEIKTL